MEAALQVEADPSLALEVFAQVAAVLGYGEMAARQLDVGSALVVDVTSVGVVVAPELLVHEQPPRWMEHHPVSPEPGTTAAAPPRAHGPVRAGSSKALGVLAGTAVCACGCAWLLCVRSLVSCWRWAGSCDACTDRRLQIGPLSGFRTSMRLWHAFGLACLSAGRQHDAFACLKNADVVATAAGDPLPRAMSIHLVRSHHNTPHSGHRFSSLVVALPPPPHLVV